MFNNLDMRPLPSRNGWVQRKSNRELGSCSEVYPFRVDFRAWLFIKENIADERTVFTLSGSKPFWAKESLSRFHMGLGTP